MKKCLLFAMLLCATMALGPTGCTRQDSLSKDLDQAAREMEKASSSQAPVPVAAQPAPSAQPLQVPSGSAAETQPPPAQQLNQALAVYRAGDYEDAVTRLQRLRAMQAMSPQQRMALQNAMAAVMTDIYTRAAKGDPRAQQAVKEYEKLQTAP